MKKKVIKILKVKVKKMGESTNNSESIEVFPPNSNDMIEKELAEIFAKELKEIVATVKADKQARARTRIKRRSIGK